MWHQLNIKNKQERVLVSLKSVTQGSIVRYTPPYADECSYYIKTRTDEGINLQTGGYITGDTSVEVVPEDTIIELIVKG